MIIKEFNQVPLQYWIYNSETFAFDIETTGLNTRKDKVIGFGLSDGTNSAYFVHLEWDGEKLVERLSKADCEFVLHQLHDKKLICYNSSFDIRFTKNYFGVNLLDSLYSDGMLAFHTVQEEGVPFSHKPFALKSVAAHFMGDDVTAEQAEVKASIKANGGGPNEFYKADTDIMAKYCQQDCKLTYALAETFHSRIENEGLSKFYFQDEVMPLLKHVTIPMEMGGIPIDVPRLQSSLQEISLDLADLEAKVQAAIRPYLGNFETWFLNKDYPASRTGSFAQAAIEILDPNCALPRTATGAFSLAEKAISSLPEGRVKAWLQGDEKLLGTAIVNIQRTMHGDKPMFNLLSKHHLKKLFFEELKETALSYTETGLPQCDENFLDSVQTKYDWVPLLIQFNKLTKIKGTYIERFLEQQEDGMFYPSFQQHRTTSGRYGSDLQQLPRPLEPEDEPSELIRKHNNRIREFFISGTDHKFLDADYNSLEVVVFADDAGDESLLQMIRSGEDFYSRVAIDALGLQEYSADKKAPNFLKKHKPAVRQAAKVYGLGIRYGMEEWKLSHTLNIGQDEAKSILRKYFKAYPKLAVKMDHYERCAKEQGFVQSKAGRKRHLPRAAALYEQYGDELLDSLLLWKKYNTNPGIYEKMKRTRRDFNNLINNALNFPIQSLAASIVSQSSIAIAKWLKEQDMPAYICLSVHDQVVIRCPDQFVDLVRPKMKELMENTIKLQAPLVADPAVGTNLRETH